MTVKHTPGPWNIKELPQSDGKGSNRLWVKKGDVYIADCGNVSMPELVANARLIASAPELLFAAKIALNMMDRFSRMDQEDSVIYLKIKDAIARAEGRNQK